MPWRESAKPLAACGYKVGVHTLSEADASLKEAMRIFCKAGLGNLAEFYVDPLFQKNLDRHKGEDGWLDQAYVTYMAAKQAHDTISAEEDLLVQSVHHFSQKPVVVANFNNRIPRRWTPERYPNLILMHARSTKERGKSFNFNKFTSMLFTKVKAGIVLDADQFANRGLDSMLQRASEETTKEYPYPIMPVHWMSRDPEDQEMKPYPWAYSWHWRDPHGPKQIARWGHAHPTFGHHALPWLAKWTSYVLAPAEARAPAWLTKQGWVEDEDLMNVALWASNATKQWCKFDIPAPSDFSKYLTQAKWKGLFFDAKYYKKGIPFMFFTAHDAKKPNETYAWLSRLWNGEQKRAILYDGKWFNTGKQLKAYDESLKCMA